MAPRLHAEHDPVTPARWETIKAVFLEAIAIASGPDRQRFLETACPEAAAKQAVERMLRQDDRVDGPLSPFSTLTGKTLLHYEIIDHVGSGAMGSVYQAFDRVLHRFVALKVLTPLLMADDESVQRFAREARCLSALDHPNIVAVYDLGQDKDLTFIVMELVLGKSLGAVIPPGGLGLSVGLNYAVQIAEALVCAHAAGVVHRDLKPSNIRVSDKDLIKVVDFGLAKRTKSSPHTLSDDSLTRQGTIFGSAGYLSPEQVRGQVAGALSDIFSFGAILFEIFAGSQAFPGETSAERMAAVLKDAPAEPPHRLPAPLLRVIHLCLVKDAAARFQSMSDVLSALKEVKGEEVVSCRSGRPRDRVRRWRHPLATSVVALFSLLLVGNPSHPSKRKAKAHPTDISPPTPQAVFVKTVDATLTAPETGESLSGTVRHPDPRPSASKTAQTASRAFDIHPLLTQFADLQVDEALMRFEEIDDGSEQPQEVMDAISVYRALAIHLRSLEGYARQVANSGDPWALTASAIALKHFRDSFPELLSHRKVLLEHFPSTAVMLFTDRQVDLCISEIDKYLRSLSIPTKSR